jgi:hypothetical protein
LKNEPDAHPDLIRLDTLGKLYPHGHGIGGYCCSGRRTQITVLPKASPAGRVDATTVQGPMVRKPDLRMGG